MSIYHVALLRDWEHARTTGAYTTSTLGVPLAEQGFIHASHDHQWRDVLSRFYADVHEPLVLLEIDPDRLTSRVVEETPPGGSEAFPHIYGPIEPDAVVRVVQLQRAGSFSEVFLREMFRNVLLASLVLAGAVLGALAGDALLPGWGRLAGAAAGTLMGGLLASAWVRRRRR